MRTLTLTIATVAVAALSSAQNGNVPQREEITFITDNHKLPDAAWQSELRHRPNWRAFVNTHGTWYAAFNEYNAKPHRAYGKPIPTTGSTPLERAENFIAAELSGFGIPTDELQLMSVAPATKCTYVHFKQRHAGLEVLFSHLLVKLDNTGRVITFGTDVYDAIVVDPMPSLSTADAPIIAATGLTGITGSSMESEPRILPVPAERSTVFHLVYEVMVNTMNDQVPGHYRCYVDAHNGQLLYRTNLVRSHDRHEHPASPPASADVTLSANVYQFHPYIPAVEMPLLHAEVTINGTTYNTDDNGQVVSGTTGPVSATFRLRGFWSSVRTSGVTPQFTTTLNDGPNGVSFDANANIRERSAYYHVNIIHDQQKDVLDGYTGMDFQLPTNVDVAGTCNAFYDGSSINFYSAGGGCQSYAQIGEVVYHEYGHGVNDNFYQDNGSFFQNGAMNEGYADVWALSITQDPIMAEGSDLVDPDVFIRRYDVDPKVYPSDITGEVHADGEIIAGAWWDTYVLLGNDMDLTMDLFAEAFPGLQAQEPNGNEGVAYSSVLLDVLNADDDDGDITNGTPNGLAILEAFAIHGITLVSSAELEHDPIEAASDGDPINVEAELELTFPFSQYLDGVLMRYRVNDTPTWTDVLMTNSGGSTYTAQIPAQPQGTVVAYYLAAQDIYGQVSSAVPVGADLAEDPNIPYFILVGYALEGTEDGDFNSDLGNWSTGMPGDNASTGAWTLEIPEGSFTDDGIIVQTDEQHTPGGELCYLTENAAAGEAIGTADVDAGRTTLQSDPIDMSDYTNPTLTYWRWYTNNPPGGANPGMDWWQVQVTNNGTNWVYVENTKTSDKSWRRFAFRVQDYVTPNATVSVRFIASDSTHIGEYLDGGSLIEAAIDDIQLWENAGNNGIAEAIPVQLLNVYPDPANDEVNISAVLGDVRDARWQVIDALGRTAIEQPVRGSNGTLRARIDVHALPAGSYVLRAVWSGGGIDRRFSIVR